MLFTPEIQRDLGEATAVLDGENLLVGNGHWAMVIAPAASFLPEDLLERVFVPLEGKNIDYRVLCGSHIDVDSNLFQPALAKKLHTLVVKNWGHGYKPEVDAEAIYAAIDRNLRYENRESIIDVFYSGKARAVYPNKDEPSPSARFRSLSASRYVIRMGDKGRNVAVIEGGYLRGLAEMGVELLCPLSPPTDNTLPGIEICLDGDDYGINGTVMPRTDSDITTSDSGKRLYEDAAAICWMTEDEATDLISSDEASFHPVKVPDQTLEPDDLDVFLSQHHVSFYLKRAVSVLRWIGWAEDHIFKLLKERQYDAWCVIYSKAISVADSLLKGDKIPHVYNLIDSEGPGSWPIQTAMHRLKTETKTVCQTIENLSDLMGESLGYGSLPELVREVDELERQCGL